MGMKSKRKKNQTHGQQNPGIGAVIGVVALAALAVVGLGVWAVADGIKKGAKKVKEELDDASKKAEEFQTERDKRQAQLQTMLDQAVAKYAFGTVESVPGWGGSSSELSGDGYLYRIVEDDVTREDGTFLGVAAWLYPGSSGVMSMRGLPGKSLPDHDSRLANLAAKLEAELRLKKPATS
jgi:hypothetical protein